MYQFDVHLLTFLLRFNIAFAKPVALFVDKNGKKIGKNREFNTQIQPPKLGTLP